MKQVWMSMGKTHYLVGFTTDLAKFIRLHQTSNIEEGTLAFKNVNNASFKHKNFTEICHYFASEIEDNSICFMKSI